MNGYRLNALLRLVALSRRSLLGWGLAVVTGWHGVSKVRAVGGWSVVGDAEILAVHAAMLPTGDIIYFGGSEYTPAQNDPVQHVFDFDHSRLYRTATGDVLRVGSPSTDVFCCGHALLADGRLLVAGGTQEYPLGTGFHHHHWPGTRDAWIFDGSAPEPQWEHKSPMREAPPQDQLGGPGGGRWYPTLVTLGDGNVLAMSGHPSLTDGRHTNNTPEVYITDDDRWDLKGPLGLESLPGPTPSDPVIPIEYPRLHLLSGGDVFSVTPLDETNRSLRYNPRTEERRHVGEPIANGDFLAPAIAAGLNTTSVLLPLLASQNYRARILLLGSQQPQRIDPDDPSPSWTPTAARALAGSPRRFNANAVLLPTGDVFVSGGISDFSLKDTFAVRTAELYHPETDEWETLEDATVVRNYHSVALLMPDGRVWTAGSNFNHDHSEPGKDTRERRMEVYTPSYVNRSRPQITSAPTQTDYGQTLDVQTPQAENISRVALIRAGSATHAFNFDQRYVEALFEQGGGDLLRVKAPSDASIAPPGPYMLFLLDTTNTPSVGHFVQLSHQFIPLLLIPPAHQSNFAVAPLPGIVEVFWIRPDGLVFTNARDPNINGGNWNNPVPIAPNPGSADPRSGVGAVAPAPGVVEVFWMSPDGMVFTNARDPNINGGDWNNPITIAPNPGSAAIRDV